VNPAARLFFSGRLLLRLVRGRLTAPPVTSPWIHRRNHDSRGCPRPPMNSWRRHR